MFVDFNILNQLGSPSINSNTFANRPAAGQTGRLFVSTDTYEIYRDNGTTWDLIGGPGSSTVTGTGAATQVAYWTAAQAIGGSNNLWWDNTNGFLGVGTAAPTTRIEAVKTDGIGIYANFTTNAGSGSGTTGIYSINNTNSSGYAAVIEERTPNTTGGQYPLLVKHSLSAGTAAIGMGTGLQFQLPDDAGTFKTTQLTIETTDAAAATYKTRYRFNVQNNGSSTPIAYINSTGLGVFTATPSAALDIHSTGVIAALNSTGSTNNGYLAFQRAGTGIWRIGDNYNGGNNFFELHNTTLATDALQVAAATNKTSWQATETYTTGLARGNYFDFNVSVSAGGSFSSPNAITALGASLDLTLAGSATIPSGARSGLDAYNSISFTGTGTLTHNQGTQIRAYSNLTAGWAFGGSATGTITHLAGMRVLFPDNTGSAVTVTNNYALLLNDQTANTGTVTYTNRWGVYQEGSSDLNYMAANLLLGSTVNTGDKIQITGNELLNGVLTLGAVAIPAANAARLFCRNTDNNLYLQSGTGNTTYLLDSTQNSMYSVSPVVHNWLISNAVKMTLDASGNLGVGLSPNNRLTVGVPTVSNSVSSVIRVHTTGTYDAGGSPEAGGSIQFGQYYDTYPNWTLTQIAGVRSGTSWGGAMLFYTNDNSAATNLTERVRITSSGNFGIGTGSSLNSSPNYTALNINGLTGSEIYLRGSNTDYGYIYANVNNVVLATQTSIPLIFQTNATERARFTSGGNFLLGTSTDSGQRLVVSGDIRLDTGANDSKIIFKNNASANVRAFSYNVADGSFSFNSTGGSLVSVFYNSGDAEVTGSIRTGAPSGGTSGAWKLGSRVAATVALDTTQYIELQVGATTYKLAIVT